MTKATAAASSLPHDAPEHPDHVKPGPPIRVLLADRDGPARRAIAALLGDVQGVALVATVSASDAIPAALHRMPADVLIIGDRLLSGSLRGIPSGQPHLPALRTIVIGLDDAPAFAERAYRVGAEL